MPYKSEKQGRALRAAAHDKGFAKKTGIKQSAAKKMVEHSKGKNPFGRAARRAYKDRY